MKPRHEATLRVLGRSAAELLDIPQEYWDKFPEDHKDIIFGSFMDHYGLGLSDAANVISQRINLQMRPEGLAVQDPPDAVDALQWLAEYARELGFSVIVEIETEGDRDGTVPETEELPAQ